MSMERPLSPNLEVRDLRLVLALTSTGTTARAAEVLHLAQPSVSRALLSLENRLSTRLFERTPRGLSPTAAGHRLVASASSLLTALRDLERSVCAGDQPAQRIRLVCECYTAYHWLPSTLEALRDDAPELSISLHLEHTDEALDALLAGTIDAALITSPRKADEQVMVAKLFADEIVFVLAATHPLAAKASLTPADLCAHQLFTARPTPKEALWFMSRVFGRKRPRLDIHRIPLTEAIVDLARAGLGIGLLTEWVVAPHLRRGGLVAKRLSKGPLRRSWQLAWRREIGPAGPHLVQALRAGEKRTSAA